MRKFICIVTALIMMLTMTGTGIFAATEVGTPEQQSEPSVDMQQTEQDEQADPEMTGQELEDPELTEQEQTDQNEVEMSGDLEMSKAQPSTYDVTYAVKVAGEWTEWKKESGIPAGSLLTKPEDPTEEGSTFVRWEYNGKPFDFDTVLQISADNTAWYGDNAFADKDIVLQAKFIGDPVLKTHKHKNEKKARAYMASFHRIILEWGKVAHASEFKTRYYVIYRSPAGKEKWTPLEKENNKHNELASDSEYNKYLKKGSYQSKAYGKAPYKGVKFRDQTVTSKWAGKAKGSQDMYAVFDYKLVVVTEYTDRNGKLHTVETKPAYARNATCIPFLKVTVKTKIAKNLKCHCCGKAKIHLKKGTRVETHGYTRGYYKFFYKVNGKEHWFRVSAIACKGDKKKDVHYVKNKDLEYTRDEAVSFMKAAPTVKTKGKYCILVLRQTQHLYLMQKSGSSWKCVDDWDVSTGQGIAFKGLNSYKQKTIKAATLTSDTNLNRWAIRKHIRKLRGIPYWNVFYGKEQALHGVKNASQHKALGTPVSMGCVRSDNKKAQKMYSFPFGTRVIIY